MKNENIQKQNNYNGLRETSSLRMRKEVRLNRHSTVSDVSVFAIQGQPQIKMDWKIFWWELRTIRLEIFIYDGL